jgi:hypothetical protein
MGCGWRGLVVGPVLGLVAVLMGCGKPAAEGVAAPMEASPLFGTVTVDRAPGAMTLRLDRALGKPEPSLLGVLINSGPSGEKACYVLVEVAAGLVRLVHDSGAGSAAAGADGRVGNGQCEVTAGPVERSRRQVAVRLRVAARPGFAGVKQLYTIAQDGTGENTGLAPAGEWRME